MCECVCEHLRKKKMRGEITEFIVHGEEKKKGANVKLIK